MKYESQLNNSVESLTKEIFELLKLKREGDYWDFKKEWYHNKSDLLHDIICMANNLSGHNGYIIIGIDEENNFNSKDVTQDINRRNSQNIVDFLSSKHFAGDLRPFAYVESIVLGQNTIDVLVVISDNNVPYYLKDRFEKVCANNIYTRVGDTNTPINKSADINYIEKLWRRRFGIDLTPIDKLKIYLGEPKNWVELYNGNGYYYKNSPEFRILDKQDDTRTAYEYYMFSQMDSNPHWYITYIYYHQTPIEEILCNLLDGGRLFIAVPDWRSINPKCAKSFMYRSYVKDSLSWLLNNVLASNNSEADYSMEQLMSCVLLFETEHERSEFERYVINNYDEDKVNKYNKQIPSIKEIPDGDYKELLKTDYKNALYLKDKYRDFLKKQSAK